MKSSLRDFELPPLVQSESDSPRQHPVGKILRDAGLISAESIDRVRVHAREKRLRFGSACVALGLISVDQLRRVLAYQFGLPVVNDGTGAIAAEVIAAHEVNHPLLDDLLSIRSEILLRWREAEAGVSRTLSIISPSSGEGRSFLAANLAVMFSQMGQRTVLIDADLRRPRQHALFTVSNRLGLSTFLAERRIDRPVIHRISALPNLAVISSGPKPPNPVDLLSSDNLSKALRWCEKSFDVIIVDTPAAARGPDAMLIASQVRGCVLVGRQRVTRFEPMQRFARELASAGAPVIGSVMMRH